MNPYGRGRMGQKPPRGHPGRPGQLELYEAWDAFEYEAGRQRRRIDQEGARAARRARQPRLRRRFRDQERRKAIGRGLAYAGANLIIPVIGSELLPDLPDLPDFDFDAPGLGAAGAAITGAAATGKRWVGGLPPELAELAAEFELDPRAPTRTTVSRPRAPSRTTVSRSTAQTESGGGTNVAILVALGAAFFIIQTAGKR